MQLQIKDLSPADVQYYLQHLVAPRPICFASTLDREGRSNLSPFSFFNLFSVKPPVVIFSPSRRVRDNTTKHTLENVIEVPEVVINIVSYHMVQQTSLASCEYPKGVDEFIKAGFTKQPATIVKPFMVKEAKVKLECKVVEVKSLGNVGGAGQLVLAEVICIHIDDDVLEGRLVRQDKLDLVARLGGDWYARITASNLFQIAKPNSRTGIGIDRLPESIRKSKVLTGNHLAQLANVEIFPEKDQSVITEIIEGLTTHGEVSETSVHLLVRNFVERGEIQKAWQMILYFI